MFVEHLTWTVPAEKRENALNLLAAMHHYMHASGGMVRCAAGCDASLETALSSLTFWKSWEDLARFLEGPKSSIIARSEGGNSCAPPVLHHYEIVWEYPAGEAARRESEFCAAVTEFDVSEREMEALLDGLRHGVPRLSECEGFASAGLWVDKSNPCHLALAVDWGAAGPPAGNTSGRILAGLLDSGRSKLYRLKVTDPHHSVVS